MNNKSNFIKKMRFTMLPLELASATIILPIIETLFYSYFIFLPYTQRRENSFLTTTEIVTVNSEVQSKLLEHNDDLVSIASNLVTN